MIYIIGIVGSISILGSLVIVIKLTSKRERERIEEGFEEIRKLSYNLKKLEILDLEKVLQHSKLESKEPPIKVQDIAEEFEFPEVVRTDIDKIGERYLDEDNTEETFNDIFSFINLKPINVRENWAYAFSNVGKSTYHALIVNPYYNLLNREEIEKVWRILDRKRIINFASPKKFCEIK